MPLRTKCTCSTQSCAEQVAMLLYLFCNTLPAGVGATCGNVAHAVPLHIIFTVVLKCLYHNKMGRA